MSDCEFIEGCPFFSDQLENMPAVSQLLKRQYCHGVFAECARYRVCKANGPSGVPKDLFPQEGDRADAMIGDS